MLKGVEGVSLAALLVEDASGPATHVADELGVYATTDERAFVRHGELDVVVDASGGSVLMERAARVLPSHVEVAGVAVGELLGNLLVANHQEDAQGRSSVDLGDPPERDRAQERRLSASKSALEVHNVELQEQLSEIFFTHEFFKALTRYTSVDDVCSLVVDGLNGVLGSEISAVYLANRDDWTLRLRGSQGRSAEAFASTIPVTDTILGAAFSGGPIQEPSVLPGDASCAWIDVSAAVQSQAAVPLVAGENVLGVLITASSMPREFSPAEMDRFAALGNQTSLSLQNALLLAELERLSVTDRLTQLYNHGYFHQRLEEEFSRASRFGHSLSLVILDVDDFKAFNDTYGHPRGDDALRAVSSVIRANLRDMDIAGRYGGEEFVVLLPETDRDGALLVAERIRVGVANQQVFSDETGPIGCRVSSGVASYPDHASSTARLVEVADRALYEAKRAGKNRIETAG
jgi:diguanylate cyclase (GGDEF)-like protein